MHIDSIGDFVPLIVIGLTIWLMRARFASPVDISWPLFYYAFLVIFARYNEGDFNNFCIFGGVLCALFLRYEFMAGSVLKAFRAGEFVVHLYVIVACFLMLTRV
jgi:hypothetical protein